MITLFVKRAEKCMVIFLVYVNDMIVIGDDSEEIDKLKKMLVAVFELKDLKKLRYLLGIELARSRNELNLNQRKYTLVLLKERVYTGFHSYGSRPEDKPQR